MEQPSIEFRVLGPLEVVRGGEPVRVPGEKERTLLALLVIERGNVVSSDRLIDELWGDDLPDKPANALQAVVSRLRRALDADEAIVTKKPGYVLSASADAVDAARFEDAVRAAVRLRPTDPSRAGLLEDALSLWRGMPFADLAYEQAVQQERTRLEELRVTATEEKIETQLTLGRHREALAELEGLVPAHPLRERLRAQIMLALYRSGRQSDAIAQYHETRAILEDELGIEAGPDLQALYDRILRHDPSLRSPIEDRASVPRTNLPVRTTSFIGRDAEADTVRNLIRQHRLVSIIGPGGAGKTSLAVEVGRELVSSFESGVWFVALAPLSHGGLVIPEIADVLGIPDEATTAGQEPIDRLLTYLRTKEALLLLDNCEHVVQTVAEVADAVLEACPDVKIAATSREVLAANAEFVWSIPPLAVPEDGADLRAIGSCDAVQLLAQRAASAGAPFVVEGPSAAAAAQICRRLDGLPLAIELAAARTRSLPLTDVAQRLDQRFAVLTAGGRTTEPRHRTLRAAIDWSHDLLSPAEQALFRRLSVFAGGWTLEAAENVCAGDPAEDVLDIQGRLIDQSLVFTREGRFSMLETILAFAREQLVVADEEAAVRERHARYFKALTEAAAPELRGVNQARALGSLRAEEHNLRIALRWGLEHIDEDPELGLGLAADLGWYWYVGRQTEGRAELSTMLAAASGASSRTRARALQALSLALRPSGCIVHASADAAASAQESASLFEAIGDAAGAAMSKLLVAVEGVAGREVNTFLRSVDEARGTLRRANDAWGVALADFIEMEIRLHHDAPETALELGSEAARGFDALDDDWGRSAVRLHLGVGLRLIGRVEDARRALQEAVELSRRSGLPYNLARSLIELGEVSLYEGDPDEADRWFDEAQGVVENVADDAMQALALAGRGDAARYRGDPRTALNHYEAALALYRRSAVPRGLARVLTGSVAAALDLGDHDRPRASLDEGLRVAERAGDPAVHAAALEQAARLSILDGQQEQGRRFAEQADVLRVGSRRPRGALASRDFARLVGEASTPA